MGLLLEATATPSRPRAFDACVSYDAADGEVLWQVFSRKKDLLYYLFRYFCKAVRLVRPGVRNPLKFEIEGLWRDEAKAMEQVRCLLEEAARRGERIGVNYGPVTVDRAFPYEQTTWRGLTDPTAWVRKRERGHTPLCRLVPEAEWRAREMELGEWRSGRRETDDNASLRRALLAALDLGRRVRDLETAFDGLKKGA